MSRSRLAMRVTALATAVVLLLCGVVSNVAVRSSAATSLAIADTENSLLSLERVLSVARDAETGQRGFLLTGDAHYLQPYYAAIASPAERMAALRAKLSADPAGARQLDELQRLMPGLNGYQVARRIRTGLRSEPIVLVALTGWGQAQDLARAKAAGFDHHLVKPAEPAVLRSLISGIGQSADRDGS